MNKLILCVVLLVCQPVISRELSFTYDSILDRTTFLQLREQGKSRLLPEKGKITLFYFQFVSEKHPSDISYLSTLQHGLKGGKLDVYRILLDPAVIPPSPGLRDLAPAQPELFQPLWEHHLLANQNLVLLTDESQRVKYCGELASPDKFSQILKRMGVDFSLPPITTLDIITDEYVDLALVKNGQSVNVNKLLAIPRLKLFVFYRSLCMPCGEQLLIKELLDVLGTLENDTIDTFLVFRSIPSSAELQPLFQDLRMNNLTLMTAANIEPELEKFFLNGNPFLALFNQKNQLLTTVPGNYLNKHNLGIFLRTRP